MQNYDGRGYYFVSGDVWMDLTASQRKRVCGPEDNLAVAYDGVSGTILKHGAESAMTTWMNFSKQVAEAGGGENLMKDWVVVAFPPTLASLNILNRAINHAYDAAMMIAHLSALEPIVYEGAAPN